MENELILYTISSDSDISWISPQMNSKDGVYFAMLFTLRESRRASESRRLGVKS